jgi:hypothetical protein
MGIHVPNTSLKTRAMMREKPTTISSMISNIVEFEFNKIETIQLSSNIEHVAESISNLAVSVLVDQEENQ